jgi:hypothetical protein
VGHRTDQVPGLSLLAFSPVHQFTHSREFSDGKYRPARRTDGDGPVYRRWGSPVPPMAPRAQAEGRVAGGLRAQARWAPGPEGGGYDGRWRSGADESSCAAQA